MNQTLAFVSLNPKRNVAFIYNKFTLFQIGAGGGLGAIMVTCKEVLGGENDSGSTSKYDLSTGSSRSSREITNSFSTTWSYETR